MPKTKVYSLMMKIMPKTIVYSLMMKMRLKTIVYSLKMKIRPKTIVYSLTFEITVFTRISAAPEQAPPSIKRRTWSGMVNKRRPRIRPAAPVRRLFAYFHKMIKIHCNRCNAVLKANNGNLFSSIVMFSVRSEYILMLFHLVLSSKCSRSSVLA